MSTMERLFGRHPRAKSDKRGLKYAKVILNFASNLGDGPVAVPGLKAAAQLCTQIIEVAQKVESNQEECANIADRAQQLMEAMILSTEGKSEADLDPRLKADTERFGRDLEQILEILKRISSSSFMSRVRGHTSHGNEVEICKNLLDQSFKAFQVYNMVALRLDVLELKAPQLNRLPVSDVRVSKTPPAAPEIFFGRDEYVAQAITLIQTAKPARLAIMGPGGIGKTATALTILSHESIKATFSEARYFVPCEAATTPALLVNIVLQVLDTQHVGRDALTTLHQKLELLGPALLVLDNFETPWEQSGMQSQIADILARIAAVQHITLIVTMRGTIQPSGIKWVHTGHSGLQKLGPLSEDHAKSLFLAINPTPLTSSEEIALSYLLKEMDYIPLAIVIMAQVGSGQSCSYMLKRWQREHVSLLQMQGSRSDKLTSVEVSIAMSLQSLSITENPEAIELLSVLSHLPDGLLSWEDNLDSVAAPFEQPHHLVAVLLRTALAYIDNYNTLKVLTPIRHYTLKKHPADPSKLLALEAFYKELVLKYAVVPIGPEFPVAVQRLWPEIGNISSVLMDALKHHPNEEFIRMGYLMSKFLRNVHPSLDLLEELLKHLQLLKDMELEIRCNKLYGKTLFSLARYSEGRPILKKCKTQFQEAGDVKRTASCIFHLAQTDCAQDNLAESEQSCCLALQQYEQVGNMKGMAKCLLLLGIIMASQTHIQKAQEVLKQAQEMFSLLGDRKGIAQCQLCIAPILSNNGQFPEAHKMLEKSQEIFVEFGDRTREAICMRISGELLLSSLQLVEAEQKLEQAKLLFAQAGNMHGTASCLLLQANILRLCEKIPEAKEKTEQTLLQMKHMGQKSGIAICLRNLGFIYYELHDHNKAKEHLNEAKHISETIGDIDGRTSCLQALSLILKREGNYEEAFKMASDAHEKYIQSGYVQGQFSTLGIKTNILVKQGQHEEAIKNVASIQHYFEQIPSMKGAAYCMVLKAQILVKQKKYLEAEKHLEECQFICKDAEYEEENAEILSIFAESFYEQNLYQRAQEKLKDAQEIYQRLEKFKEVVKCLRLLSKILAGNKQYSEAQNTLEEAQKISVKIGNEHGVAKSIMVMGEILYDQDNLQDAKERLEEAQKLFEKMHDGENSTKCQKTLDRIKQKSI